MISRHLWLAALVIGFGSACVVDQPAAGEPAPVPLALGLSSYATLAEARDKLGSDLAWSVFDNPFARRGPCPRFDNTTVTIPRREVDGFSGRVVLSLVNQRLWMVQFFPDEPVRYIQWIQGRKTPPGAAEPRMITGNIKTGSKEPAPLVGVGWIDRKLAAERTAWLESCT